jgi:hypothetical protein
LPAPHRPALDNHAHNVIFAIDSRASFWFSVQELSAIGLIGNLTQ